MANRPILPHVRRNALAAELHNFIQHRPTETAERTSAILLFGLDHQLISTQFISSVLQNDFSRYWLPAIRFAPRLIRHGDESLWDYSWNKTAYREWLLAAAFDTLGEDAVGRGIYRELSHNQTLLNLWNFLVMWNGNISGSRLKSSGVSESEEKISVASSIITLHAPLTVIGFSGTGKSSLAKYINSKGSRAFDVDSLIGNDASVSEVFATSGALTARDLIYDRFVKYLKASRNDAVLMVGSSTTCIPDARRLLLKANHPVVHADASSSIVIQRLKRDSSHALSEFCSSEYTARQIARIKLLRGDHYYAADLAVHTQHLALTDWWVSRQGQDAT